MNNVSFAFSTKYKYELKTSSGIRSIKLNKQTQNVFITLSTKECYQLTIYARNKVRLLSFYNIDQSNSIVV